MSHHAASSLPTTSPRRSSTGSEKTLVDTMAPKADTSEKDYDQMSSFDSRSTRSRGSASSIMDRAAKKVKSKLGGKSSTSEPKAKPESKSKQPASGSYPDTVYMWRALAETRI
ncbi:hypothetical protein F4805DRAFT_455470 [Annulohypoxylon moriforme]|nr:hypothetical protein F4805DRAFT_455470 [Annulohypoxylon moriforme]